MWFFFYKAVYQSRPHMTPTGLNSHFSRMVHSWAGQAFHNLPGNATQHSMKRKLLIPLATTFGQNPDLNRQSRALPKSRHTQCKPLLTVLRIRAYHLMHHDLCRILMHKMALLGVSCHLYGLRRRRTTKWKVTSRQTHQWIH